MIFSNSKVRDKNVDCPEFGCDMKFFTKSSLRYHVKHIHQQNQPLAVKKKRPERGKFRSEIYLSS